MADRTALALLLLQQTPRFGIEPQQEIRIGPHLGLQDQHGRFRLIGGRQKQAIEPVFPFLEHRRTEHISLHLRQQRGHQGLEAFGALLEQPVKKLVAGDHGVGCGWLTAPTMTRPRIRFKHLPGIKDLDKFRPP